MEKIILASRSNRRISLMPYITSNYKVVPSNVDESIDDPSLPIEEIVVGLAKRKAEKVASKYPENIVVAAHTLVVIGDSKFGKPKDDKAAFHMLKTLQGKVHEVVTGVYILQGKKSMSFTCQTEVTMEAMTDDEIEYYINTGEGYEKSGAYAAQGMGSRYIHNINGDFFNMLGLPIHRLYIALKRFGVEI